MTSGLLGYTFRFGCNLKITERALKNSRLDKDRINKRCLQYSLEFKKKRSKVEVPGQIYFVAGSWPIVKATKANH